MKNLLSGLSAILLVSIAFVACERDLSDVKGDVNIYLLSDFTYLEGTDGISSSEIELEDVPLIDYRDITRYHSSDHAFTITHQACESMETMDWALNGVPFAVCIDTEVIYTGYFWPSHSSASCQWIVIDPLASFSGGKLQVELGYPGRFDGVNIPDQRNDQRLLDIFERDGKLK